MNRTENRITIVCYDITSDKLRRHIDKCMKDFGIRLQFSLFLCRLDSAGVAKCQDKLQGVLHRNRNECKAGDSLIILERLSADSARCLLGNKIEKELSKFEIY
jgi:CRISPR-associated endonuclease Cas2